jgi:undecaprenyl-phosphate 4-deoxy-4-formamido-L-arabinose transferase
VYNSEGSLPELVQRLGGVLPAMATEYEAILVNDGSRDGSWGTVVDLASRYPWVRGINLMRNYGQHNALLCGIRAAAYEIVVTIDDDLQHPPEEIPKLIAKLQEGYDVVYGKPIREVHDFWRWASSRVTKIALQSLMGPDAAASAGAFRAFNTAVRDGFERYYGPFVSIDVLLTWGTNRFAVIPVEHQPRLIGKSNYTVLKLVRHALNMMTGFSVIPLQLSSMMGLLLTLGGLVLFTYVIGRYLISGTTVPGFPFLASVIIVFSGAQLFALGIIGEYLARIHFRVMDRPPYVVRGPEAGCRDLLTAGVQRKH